MSAMSFMHANAIRVRAGKVSMSRGFYRGFALCALWISMAAAWGAKHHVPVTCNEFGAYRRYSPPADRAVWINDMRTALEKHGIGWTMWDYAGGFNVVIKENGKATPDVAIVRALGLSR